MQDRIALVTGAARGIGAAVAQALGQRGVVVAAVDRDEESVQETAAKLSAEGLRVHGFRADVSRGEQVDAVVEEVERTLGPLDYLVNAAGVLRLAEARKLTDEDWDSTFAVNATGVFRMSRAVVNRMVGRSSGSIVTVVSNAAGTARADMAAYSASKAAAMMYTKVLGLEVAQYGIRCNLVAPGSTDTPMLRSMWHDDSGPKGTIEGRAEEFRVGIPLRKLALPSDVADAVVFLLSEQAAHITMEHLTVDGGATLGV